MARIWEKYLGGPVKRSRDRLHITLNKKGVFTLNRRTYEVLGKPRAVVLYFEKSTGVIGMSSAHPRLKEAFPLNEKAGYWTINAVSFSRHYGIRLDGTEAFVDPELDAQDILQLDLRTTRKIFGGYRRKNKLRMEALAAAGNH